MKVWAIVIALWLLLMFTGKADAAPVRCHEDAPCWNWRTMGNKQRGIVTKDGRRLVVNARSFDTLRGAYFIDWSRTTKMHGDRKRV